MALRQSEQNEDERAVSSERPVDIKDWSRDHVRQWMLEIKVDEEDAEILYDQKINGASLLLLKETHLKAEGLSLNARILIIHNIGLLKKKTHVVTQFYSLKPYPFSRFNAAHRYRENSILDVNETGPIDLIQPCHEFKGYTNTPEENRMSKFTYEVIRFAAACMTSRTNGTIHFGVADKPHGQILGVSVQNTEDFDRQQSHAIEKHFRGERKVQIAKRCIKTPRFVEVLKADMTSAGKHVIEVDIEPSSIVCEEFHFDTYNVELNEDVKKKKRGDKSFFIREGSNTKSLITANSSKEYEKYTAIANMQRLSQLRKDAEEKHFSVVKKSVQGSKLCEMITGGTKSMDRSHFAWYIVVANKSHPVQLENLEFLLHMKNLVAVLDFDPESAENGLNKLLKKRKIANFHLSSQHENAGEGKDISNRLQQPVMCFFCNGAIHEETPSDVDNWLTEKGSSVRDVVSLMCQTLFPRKKLLTIFLLLSPMSNANDPLLETFGMFLKGLKGQNQILCISDNETTYNHWKDLIKGRYGVDISKCIHELSLAEVNGTILSLWSENRKSKRFLPCGGGSKVELSKKTEESLDVLSVLCVNQCEGGNEDKQLHEENFYKGGEVSWWNFYFSGSVIERDRLDYIVNTIIPNIQNQKRACEFISILHPQGWGGTTLAMHVLWTLKDEFRCAVLKDTTEDNSTVAEQVVQLLTYEAKEKTARLPVLLMAGDFQKTCEVQTLQHQIEEECLNKNIFSKSPQVIIVSCMRVESCEQTEVAGNRVSIPISLSDKELKLFGEKMQEFKKSNTNTETFYVSMMINTFSSKYIQGIVKNTLKGFNFQHKHSQLFAVLVLLHVYSKRASLSVSTCEEFLGLQTKADSKSCKVEDGFEKFSSLLTRCTVYSNVTFEAMRVNHSRIAEHCLEELSASYRVTKADITNLLLTTDSFYENTLGEQKLRQDVHNMLVWSPYSAKDEDLIYSALIRDIIKETPGMEETVLLNAAKCLREDAMIFQLLARYYIKKQDFEEAMVWATKAKDLSKENSYICNTVSHILIHQLEHTFDKNSPIEPDSLDRCLTLAESAAKACKETQQAANKEAKNRLERLKDYNTYNTAGHLGELQTAATIIQILQKSPFRSGFTYNNCLTRVLLGNITIEDLSREKPELKQYCDVLQEHKCFLLPLKDTMKQHFDFFRKIFVNVVPFLAEKDKQKEMTMCKVSSYFQLYTELFWEGKIQWIELSINDNLSSKDQIEQTREYLERNKGDSYSGLLEYLYEEDSASTLEEIIQQYDFILEKENKDLMDSVNLIYANVILANIKPASRYIKPYQDLRELLLFIIDRFSETLPLHYITVLLLWQEAHHEIPTFVSQLKMSYSAELKPLSTGKREAVHFYLGKDKGYGGLISHRGINSCLGSGQDISTQWNDERIWKQVRDSKKLQRVSGEICDNKIWVADVKVKVDPMFRSQLNKKPGTRVTFFIGFSMNGPVALDIDFE